MSSFIDSEQKLNQQYEDIYSSKVDRHSSSVGGQYFNPNGKENENSS
jgi:hypothetical protein